MKNDRVLFKIKGLEKLLIRSFSKDIVCEGNIDDFFPHPTPTQMQIIEYILDNCDKDIYQRDLEKVLNLRRATVSGVLQTMEKNGLLERVINTEDARVKKIILNEKARLIFIKSKSKLEEIEDIITRDIPKEELQIFSKVLDNMKDNLKALNK